MTDDIKDIVELHKQRLSDYDTPEREKTPLYYAYTQELKQVITALTTLSEDNAAMKLEIERLRVELKAAADALNKTYDITDYPASPDCETAIALARARQALKNNPNA